MALTAHYNRNFTHFNISTLDGPAVQLFDGVTDIDGGTEHLRYGYLDGTPDLSDGTTPTGYGLYADNVYLEGAIIATSGRIGGFSIASNTIESLDSGGGIRLDANSQFLKMYEDNGTTARLSILGSDTTLPSSATVRDSISGSSGAITSEMNLVDYEPIDGAWQPEETAGSGVSTYDYTLRYQGWNGSSWDNIETVTGSLAGSSTGVTRDFAFNDLTGYTKFRMRIEDRNSSGGNWAFASYNAKQIKTEMIVNRRGMSIVGGFMRLIDFPKSTTAGFDPASLEPNTVFSDEQDSNGNWILKVKS